MKRIVECLLEAGILEEDIHRILDLIEEEYEVVEDWSGKTGAPFLDNPEQREKDNIGHKRVMVDPEVAMRRHANMYRRRGIPLTAKRFEQSRRNDGTSHLEQALKSDQPSLNEPFIVYNQGDYNKHFGTRRDVQDGAHRTVGAMNLGHKKVPLNIYYKKHTYKDPTEHAVARHYQRLTKKRLQKQAASRRKRALKEP